jgi:hypothetical protein
MTAASKLLQDLRSRGVEFAAVGDRLRWRPRHLLTAEEREAIVSLKNDLLAVLREAEAPVMAEPPAEAGLELAFVDPPPVRRQDDLCPTMAVRPDPAWPISAPPPGKRTATAKPAVDAQPKDPGHLDATNDRPVFAVLPGGRTIKVNSLFNMPADAVWWCREGDKEWQSVRAQAAP